MTLRRHIGALFLFALFAIVWTWPLASRLSSHVLGLGPGDNFSFLWNFWWMRHAFASGADPFFTSFLFSPVGTDLTLHTHTALAAFAGATVLASTSIVTALNLTIITGLALNGFCAYLLAWRVTRDYGSAIVGGLVFGGAPYFSGHLYGHFNLTMAWTIPLVAIAAFEFVGEGRRRWMWAALAGCLIGLTAYIDYYYVVFEMALALTLALVVGFRWSASVNRAIGTRRRAAGIVVVLMLLNVAVILAILISGGFSANLGGLRVSFHSLFNPLQVLWILLAVWLVLRFRPKLSIAIARAPGDLVRAGAIMLVAFLVIAAPVVWHGVALMLSGEYVTQRYFWRSAPTGIDIGTLLLGNPFHGFRGEPGLRWYGSLDIDAIESTAWLGVAPVFLATIALRTQFKDRRSPARAWTAIGAIFFIWSLGSHLVAFGVNTGMILPAALLRYVPIVSNARIPGRAIVVAYLALSVLTAIGLKAWQPARMRRRLWILICALAVSVDYLPAPFPVVQIDRPAIYDTLRARPESGALLELPLGLYDGFGHRGFTDDRTFFYQSIHERPVAGGYISRISPAVTSAYSRDPLLDALLDLSEQTPIEPGVSKPAPDAQAAAEQLRVNGVAFVMLNRRLATQSLIDYVEKVLPLELIAADEERSLFLVRK